MATDLMKALWDAGVHHEKKEEFERILKEEKDLGITGLYGEIATRLEEGRQKNDGGIIRFGWWKETKRGENDIDEKLQEFGIGKNAGYVIKLILLSADDDLYKITEQLSPKDGRKKHYEDKANTVFDLKKDLLELSVKYAKMDFSKEHGFTLPTHLEKTFTWLDEVIEHYDEKAVTPKKFYSKAPRKKIIYRLAKQRIAAILEKAKHRAYSNEAKEIVHYVFGLSDDYKLNPFDIKDLRREELVDIFSFGKYVDVLFKREEIPIEIGGG